MTSLTGQNTLISVDPALATRGDFAAFLIFVRRGFEEKTTLPIADIPHIERHQGLRYTEIVDRIVDLRKYLLDDCGAATAHVALDASGSGRPIFQASRDRIGPPVFGFSVTGADAHNLEPSQDDLLSVSRTAAILSLDSGFQSRRIHIAKQVKLATELKKEAESLSARVGAAGRMLINPPNIQHAKYDDLVMAAAQGWAICQKLWTPQAIARWRTYQPDMMNFRHPAPAS